MVRNVSATRVRFLCNVDQALDANRFRGIFGVFLPETRHSEG